VSESVRQTTPAVKSCRSIANACLVAGNQRAIGSLKVGITLLKEFVPLLSEQRVTVARHRPRQSPHTKREVRANHQAYRSDYHACLHLHQDRVTLQRAVTRTPKDKWHCHCEPFVVSKREVFDADIHVFPELDRPSRESAQRRSEAIRNH